VVDSDGVALLRSALVLAARGWHVFPCAPAGSGPGCAGTGSFSPQPTKTPSAPGGTGRRTTSASPADRPDWSSSTLTSPAEGNSVTCQPILSPGRSCSPPCAISAGSPTRSPPTPWKRRRAGATSTTPLPPKGSGTPPDGSDRSSTCASRGYVIGVGSRVGGRAYIARDERPPALLPPWIAHLLQNIPRATPSMSLAVPQLAANTRWSRPMAREDQSDAARAAIHQRLESEVDPLRQLPPAERERRIRSAPRALSAELNLAKARKHKRAHRA
jgi:hypothetical protein